MRANREGFRRWRIVPRMLRDVSERDTGVELFGRRLEEPFLLAPIGVLEMVGHGADLAVARAAALEGVPMILSNQASEPMEDVAAELGPSPRWFQLYWSKSDELVESLVGRAEACGCEAIVVTLDTTLLGWRTRDLDVAYLPFLRGKGIAQYTSDPVFRKLLEKRSLSEGPQPRRSLSTLGVLWQMTRAFPGGSLQALRSREAIKAVQTFIDIYSRPSLTWENLAFLRERTELPILLKGVLHPDDARMALDHGVNGVVVSNHGGRQVDGAIATIEALPAIVDAIDGRAPVLLDSGIRGGADIFKALALGASAVLIGRPYVEALAIAGSDGVRELIQNFKADFDLTMGLAGCRSVAEIDTSALVRAP
jgi:lactate 2-monooxygenase